ncbi:hypothetical protein D3C80_2154360 [compost metagenome]
MLKAPGSDGRGRYTQSCKSHRVQVHFICTGARFLGQSAQRYAFVASIRTFAVVAVYEPSRFALEC